MEVNKMYVVKRDGKQEDISFDKVLYRIRNLCALPEDMKILLEKNSEKFQINKSFIPLYNVNYNLIAQKTINGIYPGVTTGELDDLAASIAQPLALEHPDYGVLAARILVSNYHKNTVFYLYNHYLSKFNLGLVEKAPSSEEIEKDLLLYTARALYENVDEKNEQHPLLSPQIYAIIIENHQALEKIINYNNDYEYDYIGFKLLEESYLQKCSLLDKDGKMFRAPIERPQHLLIRVALGIHCSQKYYDFDRFRQNHQKIFEECFVDLKNNLSPKTFDKIKNEAVLNKVSWKDIIQIIRDKTPCTTGSENELISRLVNIIKNHTIPWNDVLRNFHSEISEKQWEDLLETYKFTSNKYFTHATPTLFNAGTLYPQLSSCFLVQLPFDSMEGITEFWKICAEISKRAGGIGSHIHHVRGEGSYIRGTNGNSNGLVPMLKVVNDESVYVDQGGNKRPGSHAVYLETWHKDIKDVVSMRKNRGNENQRGKNLFYAMWICDEFMRTVEYEFKLEAILRNRCIQDHGVVNSDDDKIIARETKLWYLMCPDQNENLSNLYDENFRIEWIPDSELFDSKNQNEMKKNFAFTHAYRSYIRSGKYSKRISAVALWKHICDVIIETGLPYMCMKDAGNRKSNQKNLGTMKSSNLCVAPETKILTNQGYFPIYELKDQFAEVWNGEEWSKVQIRQTSANTELMKIKFSDGSELECTPNHKFAIIDPRDRFTEQLSRTKKYIKPRSNKKYESQEDLEKDHEKIYQVLAKNLKANMILLPLELPFVVGGSEAFAEENHLVVPINYSEEIRLEWFSELVETNGTIYDDLEVSIEIKNNNLRFLRDVKLMLQTLGIHSKICSSHGQPHALRLRESQIWKLCQMGFEVSKLDNIKIQEKSQDLEENYVKIQSIEFTGRHDQTYCFTEHSRHMGVFNGVLTMQCTEIFEYSSAEEIAVCNLASTNLTSFITDQHPKNQSEIYKTRDFEWNQQPSREKNRIYDNLSNGFETSLQYLLIEPSTHSKLKFIDWDLFEKIIRRQVRNLNKLIDISFYPLEQAEYSNLRHRPMAIGIQDFANFLSALRLPFDSEEAQELNFYLFEFMYYIACDESCEIAMKYRQEKIAELETNLQTETNSQIIQEKSKELDYYKNILTSGSYQTFIGSPASRGELQFDLWIKEQEQVGKCALRYRLSLNWPKLKTKIVENGLRNSLLLANMPTGSTSTVMGCSACFEPYSALLYKRRNRIGEEFYIIKNFIEDLISLGLWNKEIRRGLEMSDKGSISELTQLPKKIRDLYKTVWDISPKVTSEMCLGRGPLVCQSQSYTLFKDKITVKFLTQFHFYNWKNGAKTSSYYSRQLAPVDASKLQVDTSEQNKEVEKETKNTIEELKKNNPDEGVVLVDLGGSSCVWTPGCIQCQS